MTVEELVPSLALLMRSMWLAVAGRDSWAPTLACDLAQVGLDGGSGSKVEPGRDSWPPTLAYLAGAGLDALILRVI